MANKYEVLHLLGKGGMSSVYKAQHVILGKVYAVKIMHRHMITDVNALVRFKQEAAAAASLSHPNIITVHDFATESEQPFQTIDYLEGTSLIEEIKKHGKLPPERALGIFAQACSALAHAHQKGVIHRDLKPSNIMLIEKDGLKDFVKLVDFGIAKVLPQEGEAVQQLTQTGEVFGSPLYMSPEQCLGLKLDTRSDIYSMGCLMYETLTGHPPLSGSTVFATIQKHIDETPKPLKDELGPSRLVDALDTIVAKTLAKQPEQRYQSMDELLKELQEMQQGTTGSFISSLHRNLQVAAIRLEPLRKRTPLQLLVPLAVTFCLLFVAIATIIQMLSAKVPPYADLQWKPFSTEATVWGTAGKNDDTMALASLTLKQLVGRAEQSRNAADPAVSARYLVSLIDPFAKNGNYEAAATLAPKLMARIQEIEAGQHELDVLKLMKPGSSRVDAAHMLTGIGDACYVRKDYKTAEFFYTKAEYQLSGLADHLNQRIHMKLGDCAYEQEKYDEADKWWHGAARIDPEQQYPRSLFNINDELFSEDRASWMGKVGDVLARKGDWETAAMAYNAAAKEWNKNNTEGIAGQAYYKLAECELKLGRIKDAENSLQQAIEAFNRTPLSAPKDNLPAVYKKLSEVYKVQGALPQSLAAESKAISLARGFSP